MYRSRSRAFAAILLPSNWPATKYSGSPLAFFQYRDTYLSAVATTRQHAGPQIGMRQADIPGRIAPHRMPAQEHAIGIDAETAAGIPQRPSTAACSRSE